MATTISERPELTCHDLLLRLAGRIPDPALHQARKLLAANDIRSAAGLLVELLAQAPIVLSTAELAAIRQLIGDASALADLQSVSEPPALRFGFSGLDKRGEADRDGIDQALVAAADGPASGVTGLWRTWRYFVHDNATEPDQVPSTLAVTSVDAPLRVYIAQVAEAGLIKEATAKLLAALPEAAEAGVEVITLDADPPAYQRAALAESRLLWARATEPEFLIARAYDYADPIKGPGFAADHAVIDDGERREALLGYLRGGYPVLMTAAAMNDVLDQEAGAVVPASFRTDGTWIWTDTVEYYLNRYGYAPDAELTGHIEAQVARGQLVPDTDPETVARAVDFLLHPPADQAGTAVWSSGSGA